jgi:hypothetical protein
MANEKLTAKKILTIIILTVVGGVGLTALFYIIFFSSLLFTGNAAASLILSLSVTFGIIVIFAGYEGLKKKNRRSDQN